MPARGNEVKDVLGRQLVQTWHAVPTNHRVRFPCTRLTIRKKRCVAPVIRHWGNRFCKLNRFCDFDLYFLCFDSIWITLIWPLWLTGHLKTNSLSILWFYASTTFDYFFLVSVPGIHVWCIPDTHPIHFRKNRVILFDNNTSIVWELTVQNVALCASKMIPLYNDALIWKTETSERVKHLECFMWHVCVSVCVCVCVCVYVFVCVCVTLCDYVII